MSKAKALAKRSMEDKAHCAQCPTESQLRAALETWSRQELINEMVTNLLPMNTWSYYVDEADYALRAIKEVEDIIKLMERSKSFIKSSP